MKEPLVGVIRGYDAGVMAVAFVNNGVLCSGDDKGNLALWDVFTRRMIGEKILAHPGARNSGGVLYLHVLGLEGTTYVMSQGRDGLVKFWKAEPPPDSHVACAPLTLQAQEDWTLDTGCQAFCKAYAMPVSKDIMVSGSGFEPEVVKVWKICTAAEGKEEVFSLNGGEKRGMCMQTRLYLHQDSPYVACLFESGHVQVASLSARAWVQEEHIYGNVPVGMDFAIRSTENKLKIKAVCCGAGDSVVAFTVDSQKVKGVKSICLSSGTLTKSGASCVCVRKDEKIFVTGGWDCKLRVFHWKKLELLAVLELHQKSIQSIGFSPDCSTMCSASRDGHIALWSIYPPRTASSVSVEN